MSKEKFHITITDNETGRVIQDIDFSALIGGLVGTKVTQGLALANCDNFDLASAVVAARNAVKSIMSHKGLGFEILTMEMAKAIKTEEVTLGDDAATETVDNED